MTEYDDCGNDIGRIVDEVFEIRYKTIPEAADMMRVAGEKLAHMANEMIDTAEAIRPNGMAKSRWVHDLERAIQKWNESHEVFVEAMNRGEGK